MSGPRDDDRDGQGRTKDGDRPGQRDWREMDRRKDRSAHRKEERPAGAGGKRSRAIQSSAQKEYLTGLNRLFDTGQAGGRVGKILPPMPKVGEDEGAMSAPRQEALKKIRAAETSKDIAAAVDAFRAQWELPEDPDTLLQVLLHPHEAVVAEALAILDRVMPLKRASRRETLRIRLRRVEDDEGLPAETRTLAGRVREKA